MFEMKENTPADIYLSFQHAENPVTDVQLL